MRHTSFQLNIATIVIPYFDDTRVWFCGFYDANQPRRINAPQVKICTQYGDSSVYRPDAPSIVNSELENFDFSKRGAGNGRVAYDFLEKRNKSFVRFAAEENKDTFIFDFVLSAEMTEKIRGCGKSQNLVQIFKVSFNNMLQIDPTLVVSKFNTKTPDLLFKTEYAGLIAYGLIEDHFAITIDQYEKRTGHDPVVEYARKSNQVPYLDGAGDS